MIRAMAPITWDSAGVAHQQLFIFQASPSGMTPLDLGQFQQTRAAVLQRAALRMQGLPAVDAEGNPLVPGLPPAAGQTPDQSGTVQPGATPSALPLSSTPQPSYKLRLPTRR